MKWITRSHVHVDRIACPWLITRFIDADAEFLFVPVSEIDRVAADTGAIPFDVPGVELGHHEGRSPNRSSSATPMIRRHKAWRARIHAADIASDIDQIYPARGLKRSRSGTAHDSPATGRIDTVRVRRSTPGVSESPEPDGRHSRAASKPAKCRHVRLLESPPIMLPPPEAGPRDRADRCRGTLFVPEARITKFFPRRVLYR
jgi:hypothetical protein